MTLSPSRSDRQRASHFTLIELLVVVAIIAVLAAMLLPALSKSRQKAKSAACLGNMKQLYVGFTFYFEDNSEWCPMTFVWHRGDVTATPAYAKYARNGIGEYITDTAIFNACPDYPSPNHISYAMNDRLGGIYTWPPQGPRYTLSQIKRPESMVGLIDATSALNDTQVAREYLPANGYTSRRYGYERHDYRPNVMWMGGNVSSVYFTDLDINQPLWDPPKQK